jgi:hypothetical protein
MRDGTRAGRRRRCSLRCHASRSRTRSNRGARSSGPGRRSRRRNRARSRSRRCRCPRSRHRCARCIQRRNRQHRSQPQTARIVRHERIRIRVEQRLRGAGERRAVMRLRGSDRDVVERLPRMNRVLASGLERRRCRSRRAGRRSVRGGRSGRGDGGRAGQHPRQGRGSRDLPDTAAHRSVKRGNSNGHRDDRRVSAQLWFAIGLGQDFRSTQ